MVKRKQWSEDEPVSLAGVSFKEALAGVLAVKPPSEEEGEEPGHPELSERPGNEPSSPAGVESLRSSGRNPRK